MKSPVDEAVALFEEGFSCSQAILTAWAEQFNLDRSLGIKLSGGFGGGFGLMGGLCGSLTGAAMVLGLKFGSDKALDKASKYRLYEKVRLLGEEFKTRAGSMYCRDLLGFDLSSPQGQIAAKQPGAFSNCSEFVRIAAEITREILEQDSLPAF